MSGGDKVNIPKPLQVALVTTSIVLTTVSCSFSGTTPPKSPEIFIDSDSEVWLCGEVISRGRAVPSIVHANLRESTIVEHTSMSGNIYLQLAATCEDGTDYSVTPSEAATVVQRVGDASDGTVFLVLRPQAKKFVITFGTKSGQPGSVLVRLEDDNSG
jgi:hypothetical protein